tara:strand:+ start:9911 stop:11218 length:1308 start_codon:yes stop_codon:yes gene_type:complete
MNILVIYSNLDYPLRTTIDEHLYSFKRYNHGNKVFYLNADQPLKGKDTALPEYLKKIYFSAILFHYGFVGSRWNGLKSLQRQVSLIQYFKDQNVERLIFPQDEYKNPKALVWLINYFNITKVFSVSPESEWPILYQGVDFNKVQFHLTLTGFLDTKAVKKLKKSVDRTTKNIDIGYRARKLPPWLGKHGYLKTEIAQVFSKACENRNLKVDISIKQEDTFLGDSWYGFMVRCKYMLGVEGGATVLDTDGDIWNKGTEYLTKNPNASFEEVEKHCFPNLDGKLQVKAISPRHLEACATKTCQILTEGYYNGILKPDVHYIELKNDFSNLSEVLEKVQKDEVRSKITERAYQDIVVSRKYSYGQFTFDVFKTLKDNDAKSTFTSYCFLLVNRIMDNYHWFLKWYKIEIFPTYWKWFLISNKLITKLGLKRILLQRNA